MANLNKFTSFTANLFMPVFGDVLYKKMRKKKIAPKPLKKFTSLTEKRLSEVYLVAHRGLSGAEPENTAPAFQAAGKHGGFYGLECDTHMSADGVWMIVHDDEISSIFNGEGNVKDYSYNDLMKFKAVRGANVEKYDELRMPTLQEYIDICKEYNCRPIIEIKDTRIEFMQSFYDVLVKNDIADKCTVISFNIDVLRTLHEIDEKLDMWYLVDYITDKKIKEAKQSGCSGMDFSCAFNACRPEMIQRLRDNELIAACWTVDDKDSLKTMLDVGVIYITTNSILPE